MTVAELLKDCPSGMELDCTSYDNVSFDKISDDKTAVYPIFCYITDEKGNRSSISFTENGCESKRYGAKCVIFPKGKTTWEEFQRPFKDGDVVFYDDAIAIFKEWGDETLFRTYVTKYLCCDSLIDKNVPLFGKSVRKEIRFATEEEKQKLFDAIKENGYKWNPETKTLEKLIEPKFKVGDRIKIIYKTYQYVIKGITDTHYTLEEVEDKFQYTVPIIEDRNWELIPNKFDITTLKAFESKVLVRSSMDGLWKPAVFGFRNGYNDNAFYIVGGSCWKQCIPYLNNEHLCGTTNDCNDFYKTWE